MGRTLTFRSKAEIDQEKHKQELEAESKELQEYLDSTDWYVVRFSETGKVVPTEVTEKREQAKNRINEVRVFLF